MMLKALQIKVFSFFCAPFLSLFTHYMIYVWGCSVVFGSTYAVYGILCKSCSKFSPGPWVLILPCHPWPLIVSVLPGLDLKLIPVPLLDHGQMDWLWSLGILSPLGFPQYPCKHKNAHIGWFQHMTIMTGASAAIFCCDIFYISPLTDPCLPALA